MWLFKIFRILFPAKEVKREVKELSEERKRELEEEWRKFYANQPEEMQFGEDIFGEPIMLKKVMNPGGIGHGYSAPVVVMDIQERQRLWHIIKYHRTPKGEYIA